MGFKFLTLLGFSIVFFLSFFVHYLIIIYFSNYIILLFIYTYYIGYLDSKYTNKPVKSLLYKYVIVILVRHILILILTSFST